MSTVKPTGALVAVWESDGFAITRSRIWISPMATGSQCQLIVPSLQCRLHWGVNNTWCTGPVSMVLQLRLQSGWGLMRSMGPWGSGWALLSCVSKMKPIKCIWNKFIQVAFLLCFWCIHNSLLWQLCLPTPSIFHNLWKYEL